MTSHELARNLLSGPDLPVFVDVELDEGLVEWELLPSIEVRKRDRYGPHISEEERDALIVFLST